MQTLDQAITECCKTGNVARLRSIMQGEYQADIVVTDLYPGLDASGDDSANIQQRKNQMVINVRHLVAAADSGHLDIIKLVDSVNPIPEEQINTMLFNAIYENHPEVVEWLLPRGRDNYLYDLLNSYSTPPYLSEMIENIELDQSSLAEKVADKLLTKWVSGSKSTGTIDSNLYPAIHAEFTRFAQYKILSLNLKAAAKANDLDKFQELFLQLKSDFKRELFGLRGLVGELYAAATAGKSKEVIAYLLQDKEVAKDMDRIYHALYGDFQRNSIVFLPEFKMFLDKIVSNADGYNLYEAFKYWSDAKCWPMLQTLLQYPSEYQHKWWVESGCQQSLRKGHLVLLKYLAKIPGVNSLILPGQLGLLNQFFCKKEVKSFMLYSALKYTPIGDLWVTNVADDDRYLANDYIQKLRDCRNDFANSAQNDITSLLNSYSYDIAFPILLHLIDKSKSQPEEAKYLDALEEILKTKNILTDYPQIQYAVAHLVNDSNFLKLLDRLQDDFIRKAIDAEFANKPSFANLALELCESVANEKSELEYDASIQAFTYLVNMKNIFDQHPSIIEIITPYLKIDIDSQYSMVEGIVSGIRDPNQLYKLMDGLIKLHDAAPENFVNPGIVRFVSENKHIFDPKHFTKQRYALDTWLENLNDPEHVKKIGGRWRRNSI